VDDEPKSSPQTKSAFCPLFQGHRTPYDKVKNLLKRLYLPASMAFFS
jgi:hypothetical protein